MNAFIVLLNKFYLHATPKNEREILFKKNI